MAIKYLEEKKLFHLSNSEISYYFYINDAGYLQHLYFGEFLEDIDIEEMTKFYSNEWSRTYLDSKDGQEKSYHDNFYRGSSLYEIAPHGSYDKRLAPLIIKHENNIFLTDFRYVSYKIIKGAIKFDETVPQVFGDDTECETLVIKLKDSLADIYLSLYYIIFKNSNVIVRNCRIDNESNKTITMKRAYSMMLDLPSSKYKLTHFHGDWQNERQLLTEPIADGLKRISSNLGRSSHEENPSFILSTLEATEEGGTAIGFALVYSGNFSSDIVVNKFSSTRVLMGINDEDFEYTLENKETFLTPQVVISYSNHGYNKMSQQFHKVITNNIIRSKFKHLPRHILLNSWEGCLLTFTTETIIAYINECKDIGANLFVLDDGWFGKRDNDACSLGDWSVNKDKIDLKKVIAACHKNNLKFGIWLEPEMISYDSDLYRAHPEYVLGLENYDLTLSRHQLVLDTSKQEVVDFIIKTMRNLLDEYEIDYLKIDNNRYMSEIYSRQSKGENQGKLYHETICGTYKIFEAITKEYPNILIENCASGGGRFDLGMLYYTPQIWCSDETDPIQRLFIQYGTSYIYPLSTSGAHVSNSEVTSYLTKANIAFFGTYGFEFDPRTLTVSEKEEIQAVNKIYQNYHLDCIINGTLHRIDSPFDGKQCSVVAVSEDLTKAVFLYNNLLKKQQEYRRIKIPGLDEKFFYKNSYDGKIHSGSYYRLVGLNMSKIMNEFESYLITLDKTK